MKTMSELGGSEGDRSVVEAKNPLPVKGSAAIFSTRLDMRKGEDREIRKHQSELEG